MPCFWKLKPVLQRVGLFKSQTGSDCLVKPIFCARYFDRIMAVFIEVVLNWDMDNNCSRRGPGFLVARRRFMLQPVAELNRTSSHAHADLDRRNAVNGDEYYQMCSLDCFRSAMIKYVDALRLSGH
ncbi:hypothetical protein GQ600_24905 [Phytophthora cactorum]|nr:hypothetical protein GQ600_24905 [Phytophthora cactorum]